MKCTNPEMNVLVSMYQCNLLSEEEKLKAEAHILACPACFKEFYQFNSVVEALEAKPEEFIAELAAGETVFERAFGLIKNQVDSLKNIIDSIFSALINWWKRPAIKILAPVFVIAILAIIFLLPSENQYSDLAELKKAPYEALKFKGQVDLTPEQKFFIDAMEFYRQDKYKKAIPKLVAFLQQEPNNAYGHFYLGISFILERELNKGIGHLHQSSEISQAQGNRSLLEQCYWYLGNGHLKKNDGEQALIEFEKCAAINGEYETEARKLIAEIEKMREKNARD